MARTGRRASGFHPGSRCVKMTPMTSDLSPSNETDPVITEAVENISNRFGAQGLCDLIALAREELARAEAALKGLSESSH